METDIFTLVPASELPAGVTGWDVVVLTGAGSDVRDAARDWVRSRWSDELLAWTWGGEIYIDDFRPSPDP